MFIAHISDSKVYRGGENQLIYLLTGLKNTTDFRSLAIVHKGSELEAKLIEKSIEIIPVDFSSVWDIRSAWRLMNILKSLSPDLIAVHTSGAHSRVLFAEYIGRRNIPIVVHRRYPGRIGGLSSFKYRSPKICMFIAISKYVTNQLIAGGIPWEKIRIVYSGIEFPNIDLPGDLHKPPVVGTVSAFTPEKNLIFWIEVFRAILSRMPHVKGVIAGGGEEKINLQRRINHYGLGRRLSIVSYDESVWRKISVFLSTSRVEGLGTAILQAMAYGIPVVAPKIGGIPEVVRNKYNGYLVDGWSPEEYADRVFRLLNDMEEYKTFSEFARKTAKDFSIEKMVKETAKVYGEVLR